MANKVKYISVDELNRIEEEYNPDLTSSDTALKYDENYKKRIRNI